MCGLVIRDRALLIEQKAQFVDSVEQAMPGERIERKLVRASVGQRHSLRLEIDRDLLVGGLSEHIEQHCVGEFGKRDGKQPGLDGVVAKDVGEAGADYGAKSEIEQR